MDVFDALEARKSVRAFRPESVATPRLMKAIEAAGRAPSWCNVQPWRVYVTSGEATARLAGALVKAVVETEASPDIAHPAEYVSPFFERRRDCAIALYDAMEIERRDRKARRAAWLRNFEGFGAPHLLFITVPKSLGPYALLDAGCFLQSLLLLLEADGLAACAQASLAARPAVVRAHFGIEENEALLCGVAIGFEDHDAKANACSTTREPGESWITVSNE